MKKILILLLSISLASCSTDEINVFDDNRYIYFNVENSSNDYPQLSYTFTFLDKSIKEAIYNIPVIYAGRYNNEDMPFSFQVVNDESTAVEGKHYQLLDKSEQIISANQNTGITQIKLLRTEDMQEQTYSLTLELIPNEYFKVGPNNKVELLITDQLVKPDWWTYSIYDRNLGDYSSLKLRLWLEFMNIDDGSDPFKNGVNEAELRATVLAFRNWLYQEKDNPFDEELQKPVSESLGDF